MYNKETNTCTSMEAGHLNALNKNRYIPLKTKEVS